MTLTSFYYVSGEIWLGNSKKDYMHWPIKILHFLTPARIQMFNITSKFFSFFHNKPPVSWVARFTRDFLIWYSCPCFHELKTQWRIHCMKSVQIRSFPSSVFSCIRIPDISFFGIWCVLLVEETAKFHIALPHRNRLKKLFNVWQTNFRLILSFGAAQYPWDYVIYLIEFPSTNCF